MRTLDDIVEDLADKFRIYGPFPVGDHPTDCKCRICYVIGMKDELIKAVKFELKGGLVTDILDALPKGLFIGDSPPEEGKSYSHLGCYILSWGKDGEPSLGLRRLSDDEDWQVKIEELRRR